MTGRENKGGRQFAGRVWTIRKSLWALSSPFHQLPRREPCDISTVVSGSLTSSVLLRWRPHPPSNCAPHAHLAFNESVSWGVDSARSSVVWAACAAAEGAPEGQWGSTWLGEPHPWGSLFGGCVGREELDHARGRLDEPRSLLAYLGGLGCPLDRSWGTSLTLCYKREAGAWRPVHFQKRSEDPTAAPGGKWEAQGTRPAVVELQSFHTGATRCKLGDQVGGGSGPCALCIGAEQRRPGQQPPAQPRPGKLSRLEYPLLRRESSAELHVPRRVCTHGPQERPV